MRCWTGPNHKWFKSNDTEQKQRRKISEKKKNLKKNIDKKFGIQINYAHLLDNFKKICDKNVLKKVHFLVTPLFGWGGY